MIFQKGFIGVKEILLRERGNIFSNDFITRPDNYNGCTLEIKALELYVGFDFPSSMVKECTREGNYTHESRVIRAAIRWKHSLSTTVERYFPCTIKGFEEACEWLDKKRVEFAEQLLKYD